MNNTGYSKRSLTDKLGIKSGMRVAIVNPPELYPLPEDVLPANPPDKTLDFAHIFVVTHAELERLFPAFRDLLAPNGMLWVSWPKKAAKVPTDLDETVIREFGLAQGLVDVKVAAIDSVWSGLKFVYRLKDR